MRVSRRASAVVVSIATSAALVVVALVATRADTGTPVAAVAPTSTSSSTPSNSSATTTSSSAVVASPTTTTTSTTSAASATTTTTAPLPRTLELRTEDGTITLDVTVEPAYPRAGELVRFRADATDADGGVIVFGFNPGDRSTGSRPGAPNVDCVASDPDAPPRERSPAHRTSEFTYAYRVAAERRFSVLVATGDCSRAPHYAKVEGNLTVLPGEAASNGPRAPEGSVHENPEGAPPRGVWMSIGASDSDGIVRRVMVDWGDGSPPAVIQIAEGERDCGDEPTAYPSSGDTHSLEHIYATPGTYTVNATIVSTGCDGENEQTAIAAGTASVHE